MSAQLMASKLLQPSALPFNFVAAGEMPIKPIAWLVHGYIEQDAFTVMYGPPGKGKSFVALDVSCCIATGESFHCHEVAQGPVFYIIGEGHNGIARRLRAWEIHNRVPLTSAPLYISEGSTDLAHATNALRVADAVQQIAETTGKTPALIVIDTLARNFGGDENSASDIGNFIRHVDNHLRHKWKATVLIVHHSGKDGDRGARGSSALKGAADAEYEVSRNDDDKIIRLTPRKMKDAEEPPPLAFELVAVSLLDDTGMPVDGAALKTVKHIAQATPNKAKLGKQQKAALDILEQMHQNIAEQFTSQDRQDLPVSIQFDTWRSQCEEAGIPRQRFHDGKNTLVERHHIRIEGALVFLVRPSCPP